MTETTPKNKRLILVIGSGRCGTQSLARVVDQQPSAAFTHEKAPLLPWEVDFELLHAKIDSFLERRAAIVGDAAFYYLPYIDQVLNHWPSTKIVCLKRNKEDTVKSFLKWTHSTHRWLDHDGSQWHQEEWDKCYPKFDIADRDEACRRYWDLYYEQVDSLLGKFPGRIRIWEIDRALNTKAGLRELLDFVGLPCNKQRLLLQVRMHSTQEGLPSRV